MIMMQSVMPLKQTRALMQRGVVHLRSWIIKKLNVGKNVISVISAVA